MKPLTFLALCAASVAAIDFDNGAYTFSATYDAATSEIVIVTTQPDNTWFGILLGGQTMTNTEALYFVADGANSYTKNAYATGHQAPTVASTQSLTTTITSQTSTVTLTTRRLINPAISNQYAIPLDTAVDCGAAWLSSSNNIAS